MRGAGEVHPPRALLDVYLDETAYWKSVPEKVWGCAISGYQVIENWSSYRERSLLAVALSAAPSRPIAPLQPSRPGAAGVETIESEM